MTDVQQSSPFGTTEPGDDVVRISLDLTATTSVAASSLISKYTAFNQAFAATPKVIGINLVSGATLGAVRAACDASGITIFAKGITDGDFPDSGTVVVEATLRGALA